MGSIPTPGTKHMHMKLNVGFRLLYIEVCTSEFVISDKILITTTIREGTKPAQTLCSAVLKERGNDVNAAVATLIMTYLRANSEGHP